MHATVHPRPASLSLLATLVALSIATSASGRLPTTMIGPEGDGTGPRQFFRWGHAVAVDAAGSVFVTAAETDNVFRIDPGGAITEILTSAECADSQGFTGPQGIAIDVAGNAYVSCVGGDTVFRITPGGAVTAVIGPAGDGAGSPLDFPNGVAVDAAGNVYVVGGGSKNVFKVTPAGS